MCKLNLKKGFTPKCGASNGKGAISYVYGSSMSFFI